MASTFQPPGLARLQLSLYNGKYYNIQLTMIISFPSLVDLVAKSEVVNVTSGSSTSVKLVGKCQLVARVSESESSCRQHHGVSIKYSNRRP